MMFSPNPKHTPSFVPFKEPANCNSCGSHGKVWFRCWISNTDIQADIWSVILPWKQPPHQTCWFALGVRQAVRFSWHQSSEALAFHASCRKIVWLANDALLRYCINFSGFKVGMPTKQVWNGSVTDSNDRQKLEVLVPSAHATHILSRGNAICKSGFSRPWVIVLIQIIARSQFAVLGRLTTWVSMVDVAFSSLPNSFTLVF